MNLVITRELICYYFRFDVQTISKFSENTQDNIIATGEDMSTTGFLHSQTPLEGSFGTL